jgi:serine/threonine-protein kinase
VKAPYRRIEVVGQGGWAVVWKAISRKDPQMTVALKQPHAGDLPARRMRREIKIQRQFAGLHVMPILDAEPSAPWFAMPLAEGSLDKLWRTGALDGDRGSVALGVLSAVANGLRDAHAGGVVHRDLTPTNILALPDGSGSNGRRWVVADWGLVRRPRGATSAPLTRTGQELGTDGFAAPETRTDSHDVDATADVYSMGRILAWLLTGERPKATLSLLPAGPWRGVVATATETRPSDRPDDLDALLDLAHEASAKPEPRSPRHEMRQLVDTHPVTAVAAEKVRYLARHNLKDQRLYADELARLDLQVVKRWAKKHPDDAATAACTMCTHLRNIYWLGRSFDSANMPLRWAFTVLTTLVDDHHYGPAEDVAAKFFAAEEYCNRFEQLGRTRQWLRRLRDPAGEVMARAIRRAGATEFYRREVGSETLLSVALDTEIGL